MSDIESMVKDLGADQFPRVSQQSIEDRIDTQLFSRLANAGLTICLLQMKNGFVFVGKSACASPENYNQEIGDKVAREDAFRQIWSHEGYLLKEQLYKQRAEAEKAAAAIREVDELASGDLQASIGDRPHP